MSVETDFQYLEQALRKVQNNQDFDAVLDALIEIRDILKELATREPVTP